MPCWFIWAHFPWDLGISSADCCCHISSLFRQHPQLHRGCWTKPAKGFPLISPCFCHHQKLFAYGKTHKPHLGRTLFSDMHIGTRAWEKPCKEDFTSGGMCTPGTTTALLCPCEHPQGSTSPSKTKGVRGTIPGCLADLQTLKSHLKAASIICSSMGCNHLILKGGHLREYVLILEGERKKKGKGKKKINPEVACLFSWGVLSPIALCLVWK